MRQIRVAIGMMMCVFIAFNGKALPLTSPSCTVPEQLPKKKLVLAIDEEYSAYTPEVIGLMQLTFDKETFVNYVIQNNYFFPGKYTYQVIHPDLAIVTLTEVVGALVSKYQLLLVCISDIEGYFVYHLEYGERLPRMEHNTGFYVLRE
ncbi:hypothetical protein [uncultured Shewanella sp.]|uniref:hypothetical protein n=1 Tax=uncultured Shewanella sp. TaxID=173975 RepID=UPI00260C213E|nr:hypothetical protein [uncultured Shewanella sp.]